MSIITKDQIKIFREVYPETFAEKLYHLKIAYGVDDINDSINDEIENQKTQQLTSRVSPMNDAVLCEISKIVNPDWESTAGKGFDSMWGTYQLEHKLGMGMSKGWTGHPYSNKTPWHLLMKIQVGADKLTGVLIAMINLDECSKTFWPKTSGKSDSYSTLKIHNDDISRATMIFGELSTSTKWAKEHLEVI